MHRCFTVGVKRSCNTKWSISSLQQQWQILVSSIYSPNRLLFNSYQYFNKLSISPCRIWAQSMKTILKFPWRRREQISVFVSRCVYQACLKSLREWMCWMWLEVKVFTFHLIVYAVWLTSSDIYCAQSNHLHVSWTLWNEVMFWRQKSQYFQICQVF